MDALQDLREAWGKPIIITSGHRCAAHNNSVGGAMHSRHMLIAFDCVCPAEDQARFVRMALDAGFTGIGRYPGKGFVHLDTGPTRAWWG
jgi:uncharacterized protein YcbK (DUF882 family)